jgi:hypothetical protein
MNKIDLIIEAIRLAEYHVKARGWGDDWLVGRDDICEVAKAIRARWQK